MPADKGNTLEEWAKRSTLVIQTGQAARLVCPPSNSVSAASV